MSEQKYDKCPHGYGLCECGCGMKTELAKRTYRGRGVFKGEPMRFVSGHQYRMKRLKPRPTPIAIDLNTFAIPLCGEKGDGLVTLVSAEDLDTVVQHRWVAMTVDGITYATTRVVGDRETAVLMHRLILGAGLGEMVDHASGNGLDNRRGNLRLANPSTNAFNSVRKRSISPFRGVFQTKNSGWRASICVGGKTRIIGLYETAVEAAKSYDREARMAHGEFAVLNFPEIGERGDHGSSSKI